jgi:hypothetical protein
MEDIQKIAKDEEFKKVVINGESFDNYLISNYGRVYSLHSKRILHRKINNYGYVRFKLYKDGKIKYISGHRLVAFAFVVNPKPGIYNTVNHLDENKQNNKWTNLEWTNDKGNLNWKDCQKRRSKQREKKIFQYDLNKNLIAEYNSFPELRKQNGYTPSVICNHIKNGIPYDGYIWKH